jgi:hypothetical protein
VRKHGQLRADLALAVEVEIGRDEALAVLGARAPNSSGKRRS